MIHLPTASRPGGGRFVHGDIDGAGLGLSLAREIARAHHGDLALLDLRGDSISFLLTLPTAG